MRSPQDQFLEDLVGMQTQLSHEIQFPFKPRPYQLPFLRAMANGCKRAVLVWHRRAGKDLCTWNFLITKALQRVGTYYYFFPTFNQGRKILWDGMDKTGKKFLDYLPKELIAKDEAGRPKVNETEMQIELENGSILQVIGTDKIDNIVGTNPIGCIFSEYSIQNERAWEFIRPILAENDGWAVFVYTPRGMGNHGYHLYREALKLFQRNKSWYVQVLTVEDTRDEHGQPVVTPEAVQNERDSGMPEEIIQQEFYCSFEGANVGAYWSQQISALRKAGRICDVPWMPDQQVYTSWDLGYGDANAIWFYQLVKPNNIHVIDFEMGQGKGLPEWAKIVREKPYSYAMHFLPHDMKQFEWGAGQTRMMAANDLGLHPYHVIKKMSVKDGIDAVRRMLPRCYFDVSKIEEKKHSVSGKPRSGMECLIEYRKEYDETNKCYKDTPLHNWASNGADSFRYGALALRDVAPQIQTRAETAFDPFEEEHGTAQYDSAFEVFDDSPSYAR
jgi:phage terminase large subunit